MQRPYAPLVDMLKRHGLRPTRQRLALAKLLFSGPNHHVTAEALHEDVLRDGAKVALATVYNTLHQFTDSGLLREVMVDPGRSYFDTNTTDHHHLFFEDTGRLKDVDAGAVHVGTLPEPPAGMQITRVDLVIRVARRP